MITAGAPLPVIMRSLRRSGLGPLSGRDGIGLVVVLDGLAAVLPAKSGEGWVTAPQIADASGRSERWVRHCLAVLEDAGIIRWTRGGIVDGKPGPSWIRVVKTVLVAINARARPALEAVRAARATATAARIAAAAHVRRPGTYRRRSVHAELSASPHPPGGGSAPRSLPAPSTTQPATEQVFDMARSDGGIVEVCEEHGGEGGYLADGLPRCPFCRRVARWQAAPVLPPGWQP